MKIVLLDIKVRTTAKSKFTAINMRNIILLQKELSADCYYFTQQLINNNKKYDIAIFGFGSKFSEVNHTPKFIINSGVKKIFWIVGEYEQSMNPSLFYSCKKAGIDFEVLQNFNVGAKTFGNRCIKQHFINLNLLIARRANDISEKKYNCIYYGRWRPGRQKYFKEYLKEEIYLSTSIKNMKKYNHAGCRSKYLDTINWQEKKETLNLFRYSLYIEDEYTHKVFNNLANRWYESGFCNNVVFFDVNCWNTIRKSEIAYFEEQIKDYIVTDYGSLQTKIEYCNQNFEKHLAIQKSWRMAEQQLRSEMLSELKKIICSE